LFKYANILRKKFHGVFISQKSLPVR